MATKFDTDDYLFECINCDEVFNDEKEAIKHEEDHSKAFKKAGKDTPTGMWRK